MEGWVDLDDWVHTRMVYLSADNQTSKQLLGLVSIDCVDWGQHTEFEQTFYTELEGLLLLVLLC